MSSQADDDFPKDFEQDMEKILDDLPMTQEDEFGIPASQPRLEDETGPGEDVVMRPAEVEAFGPPTAEVPASAVASTEEKVRAEKPAGPLEVASTEEKVSSDKPAKGPLEKTAVASTEEKVSAEKPAKGPLEKTAVASTQEKVSAEKPAEASEPLLAVKTEAGQDEMEKKVAKLRAAFPDLDEAGLRQVQMALQRASTSELEPTPSENPAAASLQRASTSELPADKPEASSKPPAKTPEQKAEHAAWMRMSRQLKSAVLAGA